MALPVPCEAFKGGYKKLHTIFTKCPQVGNVPWVGWLEQAWRKENTPGMLHVPCTHAMELILLLTKELWNCYCHGLTFALVWQGLIFTFSLRSKSSCTYFASERWPSTHV